MFKNTISVGIVSGLARSVTAQADPHSPTQEMRGLIQTDAAINPGNSGGPLLNIQGEVIGINTAVAEGAQSIGFAIPINRAKRSFELAKDTGTITAPYLGIRYRNGEGGVLITGDANDPAVVPGSPADKAGLKEGDLLTAIDSRKVQSIGDVEGVLGTFAIGDSFVLTLENQGNTRNVNVTLGQRP